MSHEIKHVRGHVEVFDQSGQFVLSADNENEAYQELLIHIAEHYRQNKDI